MTTLERNAFCSRSSKFSCRGDGFERKFRVDQQRPLVGQKHRAVGPTAVRQRELELVTVLRQAVLDDDLHPRLPEGAALLLVGEHILQRGDLRGEIGDVLLRAVDHHEPLVELGEAVDGVLPGRCHRLAEVVGYRIEPLVDGAVQFRLPAGEHVAHRLDPHRGFRLQPGELHDLTLGRLVVAAAHRAYGEHDHQREHGKARDHDQDQASEIKDVVVHPATLQ